MSRSSPSTPQSREALEAAIRPLQDKLNQLRDADAHQQAEKLVGRHFKYRNCYSCPQKDSDYWWLYVKVIGMGDYHAKAIKFQIDKYGKMEFESDKFFNSTSGYVEITRKEYNSAWRKFQQAIARIK